MHHVALLVALGMPVQQPLRQLQPHARAALPRRQRRVVAPTMQAGNTAAARAFEMLGKMGMEAAMEARPGEMPDTKEFVARAVIKHDRVIDTCEGGTVPDYMMLPVDQYAIYDARLMRRVPATEDAAGGADGEIFELSVPTLRPQPGTFVPKPKIRVCVKPEEDRISLRSVDTSFFGDVATDATGGALPPNVTAEQLRAANEQLQTFFDLAVNTTLAWSAARRRTPDATLLQCRTDVRLRVRLPAPFTRVPRPLVQGAISLVMGFVGNAILPRFAGLLETDYQRWCNGTRELTRGLGSLSFDADGYLVVPEEVLQKMKAAPGGQAQLVAPSTTLDLDGSGAAASGPGGSGGAGIRGESEIGADGSSRAAAAAPRGFGTAAAPQTPPQPIPGGWSGAGGRGGGSSK